MAKQKNEQQAPNLPDLPRTVWVPIEDIKLNPDNPHKFSKGDMDNLIQSIRDFPEMLTLRPLVLDNEQNKTVHGGNKRLLACVALEMTHVPVLYAEKLTPEQLKSFVVLDNVSFGTWDNEKLLEGWDAETLQGWGIMIPISDEQENKPTETMELRSFNRVHVLLSMSPDVFLENQVLFEQMKNVEGVEYEQGAN